jgi:hypothetical protein
MGVVDSLHQPSKKPSPMIPLQTNYHYKHTTKTYTTIAYTVSAWPYTPSTTLPPNQQMQLTKIPTFE